MPTYDYQCDACGHELEIFQGINDPVKKKCPVCKKNKLKRQFGTGAAIVFKGSGFYQTDYRSESYKKGAAKENKSAEGKSDKGGEKSAEKSGKPKSEGAKSESSKSASPKSKPDSSSS